MATAEPIGTVTDLWRFPVKSMRGERLTEAFVTEQGIQGDRAYALLDVETGRVVSASNAHFPGILECTATFVAPFTEASAMLPPIRITLPSGASATSDSPALSALLSDYFHRETELIHTIPANYGSRQAEFFTEVGLALVAPTHSFMDLCPLSLISTATLASLGHDRRRFRMNVIVQTAGEGFPDNAWLHHHLTVG
ncbi:MOSC N-terminal beta barrel domain-containing protein, partial [Armatimonas sp.]|uniref:MOSC N-terminal beta barrel domain-containing protein n=1 Tax=Armatimonas sp. TaxID=1872638 RepID=UPI00286C48A2